MKSRWVEMQKKMRVIAVVQVTLLFALVALLVSAAVTLHYRMPMDATVASSPELTSYVDGSPWTNNTAVSWGTVNTGSNMKSLDIKNTGNEDLTVYLLISGLPSGWTLTYDQNSTLVSPGNWLNGTLTLMVPSDASGTHAWTSYIDAS